MLLLTLILTLTIAPVQVMASQPEGLVPVIEKVVTPSVTRTWGPLTLLYDEQFHDPVEVDEEIENIHSLVPELVDLEIIGQSYQERNLTCLRITNELNTVQKAKTLVVAHHHGREQITVELALRFILHLLNNYGVDDTITEYVDTQEIFVIPTLNPDALEVVVNEGNHWLRKNLKPYDNDDDDSFGEDDVEDTDGDGWISNFLVYERDYSTEVPDINDYDWEYWEGDDNDNDTLFNEDEVGLVDLNRNYGTFWGVGGGDLLIPETQVYCGEEPFSENETRAFRDFARNHRFAMAYSLHSGINTTYFPTDAYENWPENQLYYEMTLDFADILPDSFNEYLDYLPSKTSQEAGTSGGWGEWMYYERGTTVPITFEIYHNGSVDTEEAHVIIEENSTHIIREWEGIYGYFNPVEEGINPLWEDLLASFEYLLEMTPRINVIFTGITGGINAGEDMTLSVRTECLSPRLGSKESISILDSADNVLATTIAVGGDQTLTDQADIILPEDVTNSGFSILIGNNYTGFTEFVISLGTPEPTLGPLLIGVAVGVAVVAIVLVVYFVKIR
ncbi:MAG: Zinc carboxypeptidase precursor [Candidatus Thorarchaeota archaeon AB_25]|nr:MAG: Zinc carboxypeptidase precursor [Candidatus Thorarchaeota archaeon AB_25]